jgi:hypothetical protein
MRLPFIILLLVLCCSTVSAADLPSVHEELYGTVVYTNVTPVPVGATIVVTNHSGHVVGTYVVDTPGSYGTSIINGDRLQVDAVLGDWLYVTVDGAKIDGYRTIRPGEITRYDIVVPQLSSSPTPDVTITPGVTITEIVTPVDTLTPDVTTVDTPIPDVTTPDVQSATETPDVTTPVSPDVGPQPPVLNFNSVAIPGLNIVVPFTSGVLLICLGACVLVFLIVTAVYIIFYRKTKDTETLDF